VIARFSATLFALIFMPTTVFAQVPTMRPSNGPLNPMLVVGAGAHIGNNFPALLTKRTPTIGWGPVQAGSYVAIRDGGYALTVAPQVGDGQQVAIGAYTGADTQLWTATNVVGVLWTFAPKLAPQYVLQTQGNSMALGTPITVGSRTPGPGGVGVISGQMWVYPQH
jgi:hypothetical protein